MRNFLLAALMALATTACSEKKPAADNTGKNERETATADNAGNSDSDLDIMQRIRSAVMDDDSLSTNAHNCKIVVDGGAVTLVGPVASEAERATVEKIAMANAGKRKVVNQLEVTK